MGKFFQITMGIVTAMGGFVDIGELVFTVQSGAIFGYSLIWAVLVGLVGIIVYSEMCGRIAAVAKRPVFDLIRSRVGFKGGLGILIASNLVNIITCAAEIGGIAVAFQLLSSLGYLPMVALAIALLIVLVWVLPFEWLEKFFGLLGLFLLVFIGAAVVTNPNWLEVVKGMVPNAPKFSDFSEYLNYAYFAVGIIGSTMMPYEVYFYSSGGIEEGWKPGDLIVNKATTILGFSLGALLAISLILVGTQVFLPSDIVPELHDSAGLAASLPFGKTGLILALLGVIFVLGGAAVETCLAGAYNLAQFFGWEWGRYRKSAGAPRFTIAWVSIFLLSFLILATGVDPVELVEYSVVFSVVALPLTYLPILLTANDKDYMKEYANGKLGNFFGWLYFIIITIISILAVPLMIITNKGQG